MVAAMGQLKSGQLTERLTKLLNFHISPRALNASGVLATYSIPTFANLDIIRGQSGTDKLELTDRAPLVKNPKIVKTDIEVFEGYMHVIDRVLIPVEAGRSAGSKGTETVGGTRSYSPGGVRGEPKALSSISDVSSWAGASGGFDNNGNDFDVLVYFLQLWNPELLKELSQGEPFTLFAPNDNVSYG